MKKIEQYARDYLVNTFGEDVVEKMPEDLKLHSEETAKYALMIAEGLNLNYDEKFKVIVGALLHDIGKKNLDQDILNKISKLTNDEKDYLSLHVMFGYRRVKKYPVDKVVLDIIRHHHENLLESGYPDELPANEISIYVQIVSVADKYSAMTENRVYRSKTYTKEEAFKVLKSDMGVNQILVDILIEALEEKDKK